MTETSVTAMVGGFYLAWFVICLTYQLPLLFARQLARWDLLGLLPNWRFFAPKPFGADYHLVVRYTDEKGRNPRCVEITDVLPIPFRPLAAVWNPHKRLHFGYIDAVIDLMNRAKRLSMVEVVDTLPYRTLAKYVAASVPDGATRSVQFIVVASDGYRQAEDPVVVFISEKLGGPNL